MQKWTIRLAGEKRGRGSRIHCTLPRHWEEVSLGQLIDIMEIYHAENPDNTALLSILTGLPPDIIRQAETSSVEHILRTLHFLGEDIPMPANKTLPSGFCLLGKRYVLPPDPASESFGAMEDARAALRRAGNNPWAAVPELLGIYARPAQPVRSGWARLFGPALTATPEEYHHGRALERAQLFRELDAVTAWQCGHFFLNGWLRSLHASGPFSPVLRKAATAPTPIPTSLPNQPS